MADDLEAMMAATTLTDPGVLWVRRCPIKLQRMRELQPATSIIMLFTPSNRPTPGAPTYFDPFVPLGQSMAAVHPSIRHMAYSTSAEEDFMDEHEWILFDVSAMIVVICSLDSQSDLQAQELFAREILWWNYEWRKNIPLVLVRIGSGALAVDINGFENEFYLQDYTIAGLQQVAAALFTA